MPLTVSGKSFALMCFTQQLGVICLSRVSEKLFSQFQQKFKPPSFQLLTLEASAETLQTVTDLDMEGININRKFHLRVVQTMEDNKLMQAVEATNMRVPCVPAVSSVDIVQGHIGYKNTPN